MSGVPYCLGLMAVVGHDFAPCLQLSSWSWIDYFPWICLSTGNLFGDHWMTTSAWLPSLDPLPVWALWDCALCTWGCCSAISERKQLHIQAGCWRGNNQHCRTWELLMAKIWTQAAFAQMKLTAFWVSSAEVSLQSWGSNHSPPFGKRQDFLGMLLPHRWRMGMSREWSQSSSAASGWKGHCSLEVGLDDLWRSLPN